MLDSDLAALYGVTTKVLNQAVKRNMERFPDSFMFQLTDAEFALLRSQSVTSNNPGRGGRRVPPYAFTEHGAIMLANVLNSHTAIQAGIAVVEAFVRLRRFMVENAELSKRLDTLEQKYDAQFKTVFDAIRALMAPPEPKRRSIGFRKDE